MIAGALMSALALSGCGSLDGSRLAELESKLATLDGSRLAAIDARLDEIESNLPGHCKDLSDKIVKLQSDLDNVRGQLGNLKGDMFRK